MPTITLSAMRFREVTGARSSARRLAHGSVPVYSAMIYAAPPPLRAEAAPTLSEFSI